MNIVESLLLGFGMLGTLGLSYSLHRGTGGLVPVIESPVLEGKPIPCPGLMRDPGTGMLEVSR